ncbi:aspartate/glutamate racemase family protein [Actinomadura madurae]|uniref:aspartate/glutamate racemase family protein n=1 Tax=Actinomadura madurae TaxID=1993 RepID=UPI000DCFAA8C|nr:aspartate/glutamate racemase family protein [Actinomadura madurae]
MTLEPRPSVVPRHRGSHGVDIGVILMDTDAPRAVGDVGNARTFDFPVGYTTAGGADTERVVEHNAAGLLDTFLAAGDELVSQGARAIGTSCGFVAIHQAQMAARSEALVATSALLQIPLVLQMLAPDDRLGVVTANARTLSGDHLKAVGIDETASKRLTMIGLEDTEHFYPVMVGGHGPLNLDIAEQEVLTAVRDGLAEDPAIKAIVLECTNLPPYAEAIRATTGLPVWDVTTLLRWLQLGLHP